MKIVDCYRHSIKTGPGDCDLSDEGFLLAEKIGESLKNHGYTHLFVSRLHRTRQTLEIFKRVAGDFPDIQPEIFTPNTEVAETFLGMELWSGVCNAAERRGEDMFAAALSSAPDAALWIARRGAESFRDWLARLPDNSRSLVIGHSPFLELIILGLFNKKIKALKPCDGFCVTEDNGEFSLKSVQ